LAGCKEKEHVSKHTPWMEKWLTNPTCYPPCMEGITPGISTAKEGADKEFLLSDIKRTSSPYFDEKAVVPEKGCQEIGFYVNSNGIVESIFVSVGCDEDNTTVKEIISVYGNPDYYYSYRRKTSCFRHYIFLEKGMVVISEKALPLFSLIKPADPEILVSEILLFDITRGPQSILGYPFFDASPFTSVDNDPCDN
jgi:hypothetical protein